jgi:hypothetical protein
LEPSQPHDISPEGFPAAGAAAANVQPFSLCVSQVNFGVPISQSFVLSVHLHVPAAVAPAAPGFTVVVIDDVPSGLALVSAGFLSAAAFFSSSVMINIPSGLPVGASPIACTKLLCPP